MRAGSRKAAAKVSIATMAGALALIFYGTVAALIVGPFVAAYGVYERFSTGSNAKPRSFGLFLCGFLLTGFMANAVCFYLALDIVCPFGADAGCEFGLMTLGMPLFFALGSGLFLVVWSRRQHGE